MLTRKVIIITLILMSFSCVSKNQDELSDNAYDIISVCISKIVKSSENVPIPNNWPKDSLTISKHSETQNVIIDPELFDLEKTDKINNFLKKNSNYFEKNSFVDFNQSLKENLIKLKNESHIKVKSYSRNELLDAKTWLEIDTFIRFSKIRFNQKIDQALLLYSVSFAKNNGYSIILLMKKTNGLWEVESSQLMSLS